MNEKDTNEFILDLHLPLKLASVFMGPARYRGARGGRGSGKSWGFADMGISRSMEAKTRFLCARELQNSIRDSVLRLLTDRIEAHGVQDLFDYGESYLRCALWDEDFLFKGLRHNYREIKSTEGVDICWIEEAETISEESCRVLFPTIRKPGSEIWLTWNSESSDAPIHKRFVLSPPANAKIVKINYVDNPWFPPELEVERLADKKRDPDVYAHVWEGECLTRTEAQVLGGKWRVDTFTMPDEVDGGPYYGVDWGFSTDPMAVIRSWIKGNRLYIDFESGRKGVEIKDLKREITKVPGANNHIVRADNARPELINHCQGEGLKVIGAPKWAGSIEDGISYLRSFDEIVIHERCVNVQKEARLWSYKVDKQTGDVLPVLIDANNHWMDGLRYSHAPLIKKKNVTGKPVYAGQFNELIHVSLEELWPIKGLPVFVGLRMEQTTMCAVFGQLSRRGQLRILDEIVARDVGVGQFSKAVLKPLFRSKYKRCPLTIVSFKERSTTAQKADTDASLLIDEIEATGLTVDSVSSDLLARRLEAVRWHLGQLVSGQPAIVLSPACKNLHDGFAGGYHFKQLEVQGGGDIMYSTDPEPSPYNMTQRALQYLCMWLREEDETNQTSEPVVGARNYN